MGLDEAPPSRYDYGILLDYDPSETISRNLLEDFQNILLLTKRITTDPNIFLPEPSRWYRIQFLTDGVDSALEAQPILLAACDSDKCFMLRRIDYK